MSTPVREVVLGCYRHSPRGIRIHAALRWWGSPVMEVERRVPLRGRVLEIGCSIGVTSLAIAASGPGREVIGIDIDRSKVEAARVAAACLPAGCGAASFEVAVPSGPVDGSDVVGTGPGIGVDRGPFDAVVFADMLYLVGPVERARMIKSAAAALRQRGLLIIKEVAHAPRWKYACIRAQDRVLTPLLGVNSGTTVDHGNPSEYEEEMVRAGLEVIESSRIDGGYPYPHHISVGRSPGTVEGDGLGDLHITARPESRVTR